MFSETSSLNLNFKFQKFPHCFGPEVGRGSDAAGVGEMFAALNGK